MRDNKGRFVKGNIPYMTGRHHSEEAKEKIRLSHLGQVSWNKGKNGGIGWNKGLTKETDERVRKISDRKKGKLFSDIHKKHLSEARINGLKNGTIKINKESGFTSERMKRMWQNKEHSNMMKSLMKNRKITWGNKISKSRMGHPVSEETKEKIRQARKKQKFPKHHTIPEKKFMRIIRRHNIPYKYTGDGSFWIENINPDFVQTNGKKICVEVWGDYWHNREDMKKKDIERLNTLQKYGWQRIVFWEHELK